MEVKHESSRCLLATVAALIGSPLLLFLVALIARRARIPVATLLRTSIDK